MRPNSIPILAAVACFAVVGNGCDILPGAALPCRTTADCLSGDVCNVEVGRCTLTLSADGGTLRDSGVPDAGPIIDGGGVDAGPNDGGPNDGGVVDGGDPDAGPPVDGGVVDSGPNDGGVVDGGVVDGGPNDGGPNDGGPNDGGPNDGGPNDGGPNDGGLVDAGIDAGPRISVDTFDLTAFDAEPPLPSITITDTNCEFVFDTTTTLWTTIPGGQCVPAAVAIREARVLVVTQPQPLVVLAANAWTVAVGTKIRVKGERPLALYARTNMTVDGTIDASGANDGDGPGGASGAAACVGGVGEVNGGSGGAGGGAGGATAGAAGGRGDNRAGGLGGMPVLTTSSRLVGGCRGGDAAGGPIAGNGGAAGGALQLVAEDRLSGTGTVLANGGNGTPPTDRRASGGGGGSGGTIWLTAGQVNFSGTLVANGGSGAGGSGADNLEIGHAGARPALGRSAIGGGGGDAKERNENPIREEGAGGGSGGWRTGPTPGRNSIDGNNTGGGGGGGAAGFIRLSSFFACGLQPRTSPAAIQDPVVCDLAPVCGDGVIEGNEVCDDGLNVADVVGCGCDSDCRGGTSCGPTPAPSTGSVNLNDFSNDLQGSKVLLCDGCTITGDVATVRRFFADCSDTDACNVLCNSVTESCQAICRAGSTCNLSCNNVAANSSDEEPCKLLCEEGANCTVSNCSNVGNGSQGACTVRPFTTLP